MKKRYLRGLMLIMLFGAASESYSSWYESYMPSRPTVQTYAPWLIGLAIGGLGYRAGRYMGYDPYLAAVISLLLGGGLGGFYKNWQLRLEEKKKQEREEAVLFVDKLQREQLLDTSLNDIKEHFNTYGTLQKRNKSDFLVYLIRKDFIRESEGIDLPLLNVSMDLNLEKKRDFVEKVLSMIYAYTGDQTNFTRVSRLAQFSDENELIVDANREIEEVFAFVEPTPGPLTKSARR